MSSYSLSNVLLPAVFVSSAVFSTLTVPFALIKSEPVFLEIPPFYSGEIQPIFDGEHKDVAIPYVGFAIVVSVGAGIACVEVHRRWHAARASDEESESLPSVQPNTLGQDMSQEDFNQPEYRPEVSAIEFSLKDEDFNSPSLTTQNATAEAVDIAIEESEHAFDAENEGGSPQTFSDLSKESVFDTSKNAFDPWAVPDAIASWSRPNAIATLSDKLNLSSESQDTQSLQQKNEQVGFVSPVQAWDSALNKALKSRTLYQTCRIKVPHLKQRLFAILFEGQYYSFSRAEETKEKVLEIMALGHELEKTVITQTEKGFALWNLEPDVSSTRGNQQEQTSIT